MYNTIEINKFMRTRSANSRLSTRVYVMQVVVSCGLENVYKN